MNEPSRSAYLVAAVALHVAVLWGVRFGPPAFIGDEGEPSDAVEVGLVETIEASPEPPAPEPPPPEPLPPTPPPPEPVPELPPPPPPDAISEPIATPQSTPAPQPKPAPKPRAVPRSTARAVGTPSAAVSTIGGKPGVGDSPHATWKRRVAPAYPSAARTAKQTGRVLVVVKVNALGQVISASIYRSSGFPSLDQAALVAARASSYNPKRIAGIPLPDSVTLPYVFRLE